MLEYYALHLRDRLYVVRPQGQLGTCGWSPRPWVVIYITADSPEQAIRRAARKGWLDA